MAWTSHPNTNEILRSPGYLFWNPSALTNETTWGTKLGYCESGVSVEILPKYVHRSQEEDGDQPSIKLYAGCFVKVYTELKNYNATALSVLFPGFISGNNIKFPNNMKTGIDMNSSIYADNLLFIPDNRTDNKIMILQKAAPHIIREILFSRTQDTTFSCVFEGFQKSTDSDGILYIGDLSGGTLR